MRRSTSAVRLHVRHCLMVAVLLVPHLSFAQVRTPGKAADDVPRTVPVPNLIGQHVSILRSVLADRALTLGRVIVIDHPRIRAGTVVAQSPTPLDKPVPPGTAIHVQVVSDVTVIPELSHLSEARARALLQFNNLNFAGAREVASNAVPGTVIGQDRLPGERVRKGSWVRIDIAVPMPVAVVPPPSITPPAVMPPPPVTPQDTPPKATAPQVTPPPVAQPQVTQPQIIPQPATPTQKQPPAVTQPAPPPQRPAPPPPAQRPAPPPPPRTAASDAGQTNSPDDVVSPPVRVVVPRVITLGIDSAIKVLATHQLIARLDTSTAGPDLVVQDQTPRPLDVVLAQDTVTLTVGQPAAPIVKTDDGGESSSSPQPPWLFIAASVTSLALLAAAAMAYQKTVRKPFDVPVPRAVVRPFVLEPTPMQPQSTAPELALDLVGRPDKNHLFVTLRVQPTDEGVHA